MNSFIEHLAERSSNIQELLALITSLMASASLSFVGLSDVRLFSRNRRCAFGHFSMNSLSSIHSLSDFASGHMANSFWLTQLRKFPYCGVSHSFFDESSLLIGDVSSTILKIVINLSKNQKLFITSLITSLNNSFQLLDNFFVVLESFIKKVFRIFNVDAPVVNHFSFLHETLRGAAKCVEWRFVRSCAVSYALIFYLWVEIFWHWTAFKREFCDLWPISAWFVVKKYEIGCVSGIWRC